MSQLSGVVSAEFIFYAVVKHRSFFYHLTQKYGRKRDNKMKTEQVINYLTDWLGNYCANAGMNGFAVGVSGGIDSAVTSTLCARTGKTVMALNMPIYQSPEQVALASAHIDWLKRRFDNVIDVTVDLTPSFQSIEQALPAEIQDPMSMANTRSRLRMLTLYAFAGHHRLLVAGTGNKVEDFGVGFFTKYGDGGVDLSPIADLMKSEVRAVGRALGIIEGILSATPTDGLWPDNRSDEAQIGASYDELEWAMKYDAAPDQRANHNLTDRQEAVLSIYRRFRRANAHKMNPIPVAVIPPELK
jgi:NAD+ synthase